MFSGIVLRTLIICAFQVLLLFSPTVVNGQVNDGDVPGKWAMSGTLYASRQRVKDDAYSGAAFSGWMPTLVLASRVRLSRQVHILSLNYGQGSGKHPSGSSELLQNTQWGVDYAWLYKLDQFNSWERVSALFGAAFSWNVMSREYAGFINDGKIKDKWGGAGVKAGFELWLNSNRSLGLRMDGQLGIAGFYQIGRKQPEAGPIRGENAGGVFTWMPGRNAFSARAGVGLHYMIGVGQLVEAGYLFQTDSYSRPLQWGFQRQGITLTYTYML